MRSFIVKFFALDYIGRIFGKKYRFTRSANVIFPLLLLAGMLRMFDVSPYIFWSAVGLFFLAAFIGFVYFFIFPLTDKDIRYFDDPQFFQWCVRQKHEALPKIDRYNGAWVVLLIPMLIVVWVVIFILTQMN